MLDQHRTRENDLPENGGTDNEPRGVVERGADGRQHGRIDFAVRQPQAHRRRARHAIDAREVACNPDAIAVHGNALGTDDTGIRFQQRIERADHGTGEGVEPDQSGLRSAARLGDEHRQQQAVSERVVSQPAGRAADDR